MKKIPTELLRGKEAEGGFVFLARALQTTVPWLIKINCPGRKLDASGIDVIAAIEPLKSKRLVKVPIQIKSSEIGVQQYQKKRPDCIAAGVIVVVINEMLTDESISKIFLRQLTLLREQEKDFVLFFQAIKTKHRHIVYTRRR